ncbi:MAG: DUF835 domain-containing protein [Euryarchaeota archaeon]|nr:DUF835 domain-containing protein [Euryarchaeota archaeon]MDE2046618.1 DUF835 domain-containing protein [Thermoplasmata archaeon]
MRRTWRRPILPSAFLIVLVLSLFATAVAGPSPGPAVTTGAANFRPDLTSPGTTYVPVQLNFDPSPADGEVFVSNGSTVLTETANTTLHLAVGSYPISALAAKGFVFSLWVTNGEISVSAPNASSSTLTVTSGGGSLQVQFVLAPGSNGSLSIWIWVGVGAILVAAVVAILIWRRMRSRSTSRASSPVQPRSGGSTSSGPSLDRWAKSSLSVWERIREEELWTAVRSGPIPAASLLCFTWGRADRLATKYGLGGAKVVRLSRSDSADGSDDRVRPSDLDRLADHIEKHLLLGDGRGVVLPGVEGLVAASGIKNVNRLIEVARDDALQHHGSVLFTLDPAALDPADVALLERSARKL